MLRVELVASTNPPGTSHWETLIWHGTFFRFTLRAGQSSICFLHSILTFGLVPPVQSLRN